MKEFYESKNLCCDYGEKRILKNLTFSIPSGALVSLIGPNGSGKTTLLRVLAGLKNYSGSVELNSHEINKIPRKIFARLVSFVMSDKNFRPSYSFSVREIIDMGRLPYRGLFSRMTLSDETLIMKSAELLKISDLLERDITSLSDGERQLTFLASAFAQNTKGILLDEPTNSLDPGKSAKVFEILHKLTRKGKTVIAAVHDINLSLAYSDYFIAIRNGKLISSGTCENLNQEILRDLYGSEFVSCKMWRALPE